MVILLALTACSGSETAVTSTEQTADAPTTTEAATTTITPVETTTTTVSTTTTTEDNNPWRTDIAGTWVGELAPGGEPLELILFEFGALQHRLDLPGAPTFAGNWDATEGEFILRHNTQGWGCASDEATYSWELAGDSLSLSSVDDECRPRLATFDQTFNRS